MPLEARVKSVLSGDTVVLSHVSNPSQERILSLAYVSAPRLKREGDDVGELLPSDFPVYHWNIKFWLSPFILSWLSSLLSCMDSGLKLAKASLTHKKLS